jgi:hypothetical protein
MLERSPARSLILLAVLTLLSVSLASLTPPFVCSARADGTAVPPPREVLDDPPGVPARPVPGAPRSEPVRFRQFTANQVNVDAFGANIPGDAANEPSIAVNPLEPNKMAIGWRQFDTVTSNFRQAGWGYTNDGGRTWTFPGVIDPGLFRSDPVLISDKNGTFYYSSLQSSFLVDIFPSTDNGVSWLSAVPAFGGDKQWTTVDRTDGIGSGNFYQSWSTTGSCCGPNPVIIPNSPVWGTLDVGPDGTLYVSGTRFGSSLFHVAHSSNAQDPGVTPTFETVAVDLGGGLVFSSGPNPSGLLGQAWIAADPLIPADQRYIEGAAAEYPQGGGRPSDGLRAGFVYMLASVDPSGSDPLDVHFASSWNGGVSWTPFVRVNDDPSSPNSWQWFGTMSVAPNGRIDAIWNDTRDTGVTNMSALYYSFSINGGADWSPNERISEFWDSHIGWPQQNKIGDYYHMVSDNVGAHVAWAATFNGEQDVYYTRIGDYDCNVNSVPDSLDIANGTSPDTNMNGIPDECEEATAVADGGAPDAGAAFHLYPNTPNPFNPATTIRFDSPVDGAYVRLSVYDAGGRLVRNLLDGHVGAGTRAVTWDGHDEHGRPMTSGIYYYELTAEGFSETRSMVLVK